MEGKFERMKCDQCGEEGARPGNLLIVGRMFPLMILKPPLIGHNYCRDCAGLANVLGLIVAGITLAGIALVALMLAT